jgi:hypothetical protein
VKRLASPLLIALLASSLGFAAEPVSLPPWPSKDRSDASAAELLPAGGLLEPEPDVGSEPSMEFVAPRGGEILDDEIPFAPIPTAFLDQYFAERPSTFLIDPQHLLAPSEAQVQLDFLNYHSSDSSIDLFVYVIGGEQEIPSEVRVQELSERLFSIGKPAAVVIYPYGAPQRASFYLSPSLTDFVSAAEQRRSLDNSVMQAMEKTDAGGQFEKFLVQLSIRLYWMDRMLAGESSQVTAPVVPREARRAELRADRKSEKMAWLQFQVKQYSLPVGGGLFVLLVAWGFRRWLDRRARYRFPDFEVEPRLGGEHAAGIGAVISFASASLPPASQRVQMPGYLRRA